MRDQLASQLRTAAGTLACALGLAGAANAQDNFFLYDFNHLNAGPTNTVQLTDNPADIPAGGGQDNWQGFNAITYCRNDLEANGFSPCAAVTTGDVQAGRPNDANWAFAIPSGKIFYYGALIRVQTGVASRMSLMKDDGSRNLNNMQHVTNFIGYNGSPAGWALRTRDGVMHVSNNPPPPGAGEFWQVMCRIDPSAHDGDGSGQLLVMDVVNNNGIWRKVKGVEDINMLLNSTVGIQTPLNLSELDMLYTRMSAGAALDDIFIFIPMGVADSNPFGPQVEGFTFAVTETVTIRNQADTDLVIEEAADIALEGTAAYLPDYTLDTTGVTFPVTIAPGGSFSGISVTFDPTGNATIGDRDVQLTITTNDVLPIWVPLGGALNPALQEGMIVYLPMDGNLTEQIGTPELSADFKGPAATPIFVPGQFGQAGGVDASAGTYISLHYNDGGAPILSPQGTVPTYTYAGWFKMDTTVQPENMILFGNKQHTPSVNNAGVLPFVRTRNNSEVSCYAGWGTGYRYVAVTNTYLRNGDWHHVALVVSPSTTAMYVDGVGTSAAGQPAWTIEYPFNLGATGDGIEAVLGLGPLAIDDFAIWGRALSAAEVKDIVNQGRGGITVDDVGPLPAMTVATAGPDYAWLGETTTADFTVTIGNDGVLPVTIQAGQALIGSTEFAFAPGYDAGTEKTIAPNQTLEIPIVWTIGATTGPRTVTLEYTHNDVFFAGGSPVAQIDISAVVADRAEQTDALAMDLLLHARFDGNLADSSPNANDGATVDTVGDIGFATGLIGGALQDLAGGTVDDGYVEFAHTAAWDALQTGDFSLSMWVWADFPVQSTADRGTFLDKWDLDTSLGFLLGRSAGNNPVAWRTRVSGTTGNVEARTIQSGYIGSGRWLHIAFSADRSGKLTMYEDGRPVIPDPADTPMSLMSLGDLPGTAPLVVGRNLNNGNATMPDMPFLADDLAVWARVVEPWEMEYIHDEGLMGRSFAGDQGPAAAGREWSLYE